ncbi:GntR family transcriptional regulator [Leifsonia sp. Root112D2]|jgi:GntR family transcriptional regulator|uniref:GntR family transcriptional regulator n=1 Tax=Leifsonia sp. Root112D2 TaxID=1736426 RepID=UPI00070165B5|nr:GntR family transcriptional regulator [Leifsonia sp. Root112D2]KQV07470.1 GntR family transcriptional regulator [Leifsonia sp. Root112D2]
MQIEVDPLSSVPIYQQIRDRMVEAVASGSLAPGDQLASVRQLAVAFGINVATVTKAYEALRHEGIIRTNHKSGSVIARGPQSGPPDAAFLDEWMPRLTTLLAEAVAQGMPPREIAERSSAVLADFGAAAPHSNSEEKTE